MKLVNQSEAYELLVGSAMSHGVSCEAKAVVYEDSTLGLSRRLLLQKVTGEVTACCRMLHEVQGAEAGGVGIVRDAVVGEAGVYDAAFLPIPKGRAYARMLLVDAHHALKEGGVLYLIGQTKLGAKSVMKDAGDLFGGVQMLTTKRHCRVACCCKGRGGDVLSGWCFESGVSGNEPSVYAADFGDWAIEVRTKPGVFSYEKLDKGTELLLEHLVVGQGERVWDVGCGAGVIGLAAFQRGAAWVRFSDVDYHALRVTQGNVKRVGDLARSEIVAGRSLCVGAVLKDDGTVELIREDITRQRDGFDLIVSNPPFHQQHELTLGMMESLLDDVEKYLKTEGRLVVVANAFLPYAEMIERHGFRFEVIAQNPSYKLYEIRRR